MRDRVRWRRSLLRRSSEDSYRAGSNIYTVNNFFSFGQRYVARVSGIVLAFSLRLFSLLLFFESFLFIVFAEFFVFLLDQPEIDESEEWLGAVPVAGRAEGLLVCASEPRRSRWKPVFGGAFFAAGSGCSDGTIVGRNSFNGVANFAASSAEANSITTSVSGRLLSMGHAATNIREDITCSACALIHFTTDLNSLGGPASCMTGSSRSLSALERITCPTSLASK